MNLKIPFYQLLVLLILTVSRIIEAQEMTEVTNALNKYSIPLAGNGFYVDKDSSLAVYFFSDQEIDTELMLEMAIEMGNGELSFRLNKQNTQTASIIGRRANLGTYRLQKGYNVLTIDDHSKSLPEDLTQANLIVSSKNNCELSFVKDDINHRFYFGRRGPSVHFSYELPANSTIKWFYNELEVPVGFDPVGSYFMANGFGQGYFGMQVNSKSERRILFSVWSPFVTDDPQSIPQDEQVKLLKRGEGVTIGEFGNEGSGGQSYLKYSWQAGVRYQFLNSVEPDGKGNTIYTAYFKEQKSPKWLLIASFLRPKTATYYTNPHSFLENFIPENGYLTRKLLTMNQWVCDISGKWHSLTKARFTGDDIAKQNYRLDRNGGVEHSAFFLQNGGFFIGNTPLNSTFEISAPTNPPQIDFGDLP